MDKIISALLFCLFNLAFLPTFAQEKPDLSRKPDSSEKIIYVPVDKIPEFPGGKEAMLQFIRENLQYPVTSDEIEGLVIISGIVTKTGELKDLMVVQSLGSAADLAAIQVVKQMLRWIPGIAKGEAVEVRNAIPIRFYKIQQKSKTKQKKKR